MFASMYPEPIAASDRLIRDAVDAARQLVVSNLNHVQSYHWTVIVRNFFSLRWKTMARNRFEQVNEVQSDAITLLLKRDNDGASGSIVLPAAASQGRLTTDQVSAQLPAQDAFRSAIRLANDVKLALVVCDPDGVWKPDWGDLYQPID
jgi:hypothetical protein